MASEEDYYTTGPAPSPCKSLTEIFVGEPYNMFIEYEEKSKNSDEDNELLPAYSIIKIGHATAPRLKYSYTAHYDLSSNSSNAEVSEEWILVCAEYLKEFDELEKNKSILGLNMPIIKCENEIFSDLYDKGVDLIGNLQYDEAIEIFNQLISKNYLKDGSYYNIACCYSLQNKTEEAITSFKMADENGYANWVHAIGDDDLENIINDVQIVAIIEKMITTSSQTQNITDIKNSNMSNIIKVKTYMETYSLTGEPIYTAIKGLTILLGNDNSLVQTTIKTKQE